MGPVHSQGHGVGECVVTVLPSFIFAIRAERAQATEQRYNKLKEKHTELVGSHAELLRKVTETLILNQMSPPYCLHLVTLYLC